MNLHEYQAKKLFADYGLPVSEGYAVDTADQAVAAAEKIGGTRWVVKVQVHAGGRGKAGGVKLVDSLDDVRAFADQWIGKAFCNFFACKKTNDFWHACFSTFHRFRLPQGAPKSIKNNEIRCWMTSLCGSLVSSSFLDRFSLFFLFHNFRGSA